MSYEISLAVTIFVIFCWWAGTVWVAYKIGHAQGRLVQVERDRVIVAALGGYFDGSLTAKEALEKLEEM